MSSTLAQDLSARSAPLEYWFLKIHSGELAFLVDFIVRRATGKGEVRVSLWHGGVGRVLRSENAKWLAGDGVAIGDDSMDDRRCVGAVEDVEWQLGFEVRDGRAAAGVPVLRLTRPFDLELISRPRTIFSGHVTVARERFDLLDVPGSLTHYWGRRLPDRWHWISANAFGDSDLVVEGSLMRSRVWGRRPALPIGYLWIYEDGHEETLISPLTGLITIDGGLDDYTLLARRPGREVRLSCSASPESYNDLGEGIRQTLLGRCVLVGRDLVDSRAGLEYRTSS
jgi:hypothetical protein